MASPNTTRISLNDRFTIMQSVGVPSAAAATGPPTVHRPRPRSRSRSRSRSVTRPAVVMSPIMTSPHMDARRPLTPTRPRMARAPAPARSFADALNNRQHMTRALQLRGRQAALRNATAKQRLSLAMRRNTGRLATGLGAPRRPMRALPTTLRMDQLRSGRGAMLSAAATLRQRRLNRAIATVNKAHLNRTGGGGIRAGAAANRLSRLELARSMSKANLVRAASRGRSNSRSRVGVAQTNADLRRSNSRSRLGVAQSSSNLRRSNSRLNLNAGGGNAGGQQTRRKINRDFQQRARPRSQSRPTPSIASRLGVRPNNNKNPGNAGKSGRISAGIQMTGNQRQRGTSVAAKKQAVLNRVQQGRVSKQQRLGRPNQQNNNRKQLRGGAKGNGGGQRQVGSLGNGNGNRKKTNGNSALQQRLQRTGGKPQQQMQAQQQIKPGQGKGRRGKRGVRPGAAPKRPIKKEDLDQELDKYMSSSKPAPLY